MQKINWKTLSGTRKGVMKSEDRTLSSHPLYVHQEKTPGVREQQKPRRVLARSPKNNPNTYAYPVFILVDKCLTATSPSSLTSINAPQDNLPPPVPCLCPSQLQGVTQNDYPCPKSRWMHRQICTLVTEPGIHVCSHNQLVCMAN